MTSPLKCSLKKAIETLQVHEIVYNDTEGNTSSFNPGASADEMKLRIKISSCGAFLKGTKLKLKLIGFKDPEHVFHHIDPIKISSKVHDTTQCLVFNIINKKIPVPHGVSYIHPEEYQPDPDVCRASLHIGYATQYCFVLYIDCCKCCDHYIIPFCVNYIGNEPKVDYKCEKLVQTEDPENAIAVICNGETVYFRKPHCVTHGQVKRPIVLDYPL